MKKIKKENLDLHKTRHPDVQVKVGKFLKKLLKGKNKFPVKIITGKSEMMKKIVFNTVQVFPCFEVLGGAEKVLDAEVGHLVIDVDDSHPYISVSGGGQ
jgi:hypothetical protein